VKPNLVIPLASSYDQRFPLGDAGSQAGYDQRKVNCWYELVDNALTGKKTLVLAKRPGVVTESTIDDYGSGTQVPYLMQNLGASGAMPLLVVKDGSATKAVYPTGVGTTASATVLSDADYAPVFTTELNISGTTTYVLQLKKQNDGVGVQKAYHSTNLSAWTEITDSDWAAISHRGKIVPLDGTHYIAGAYGIHGSDINSISAWTASNVVPSSVQQDYMQGLIPFADRILLFGEETCQEFYNAKNAAGSPLGRVSAKVDRVGLSARYFASNQHTEYYCHVSNRLFFLGRDSSSWHSISLMTYNGNFERVSGIAEERIMADSATYGIWPVTFHGQSAVAVLLTAPGATTARWLMFFPEHRSWFEWQSTVFTAINTGTFFAGVDDPNVLYVSSVANNWADAGTNYQFLTQFRIPTEDDEWKTMDRCGVQADKVATTLSAKFNDTGAGTYTGSRTLDLSKPNKEMWACGAFKERYVQLSNTSDKQIRLRSFYANIA
jgi:hypothetical protein